MRSNLGPCTINGKRLIVGKDVLGKAGDRVMLSDEGRQWCQQHYPDWYSDCVGTITRVDIDGTMVDVKWDDRDRPYHYHTGCFSLHHLILVSESKLQRCSYLRRPKRLVATKMRAQPTIRKRPIVARPTLLLMR